MNNELQTLIHAKVSKTMEELAQVGCMMSVPHQNRNRYSGGGVKKYPRKKKAKGKLTGLSILSVNFGCGCGAYAHFDESATKTWGLVYCSKYSHFRVMPEKFQDALKKLGPTFLKGV